MFMEKTNILQTSYCLLEQAEIKDEIVPIVRILSTCIKAKNQLNILSVKEIIDEIGNQLDKLYMKKYA